MYPMRENKCVHRKDLCPGVDEHINEESRAQAVRERWREGVVQIYKKLRTGEEKTDLSRDKNLWIG